MSSKQLHKAVGANTPYIRQFLTIAKVDRDQHLVEGYATSEDVDDEPGTWQDERYEGEVVTTEAIKRALPDYMEWGNLREMHQPVAVGTVQEAELIDGEVTLPNGRAIHNPLRIVAKIVDEAAWTKVVEGVYKGFSIGGYLIKAKLERIGDRVVRKITEMLLDEISLADRPANPGAQIILWKGAGMAKEKVKKVAASVESVLAGLQELRDAAEAAQDLTTAKSYSDAIALLQQANGAETAAVAEAPEGGEASQTDAEGEEMDMAAGAEDDEKETSAENADGNAGDEDSDKVNDAAGAEDGKRPPEVVTEERVRAILIDLLKQLGLVREENGAQQGETVAQAIQIADIRKTIKGFARAEVINGLVKTEDLRKVVQDVAQAVEAVNGLEMQVGEVKKSIAQMGPMLREIPITSVGDQSLTVLKALMAQSTDPVIRQALSTKITELEIAQVHADGGQPIGYR